MFRFKFNSECRRLQWSLKVSKWFWKTLIEFSSSSPSISRSIFSSLSPTSSPSPFLSLCPSCSAYSILKSLRSLRRCKNTEENQLLKSRRNPILKMQTKPIFKKKKEPNYQSAEETQSFQLFNCFQLFKIFHLLFKN